MNKDAKRIVKKAAKIGGAACIAAGAIAIVTSKTALQAIWKGGEYLKDTVRKIMDDEPQTEQAAEVLAEPIAAEDDFVEEGSSPEDENP